MCEKGLVKVTLIILKPFAQMAPTGQSSELSWTGQKEQSPNSDLYQQSLGNYHQHTEEAQCRKHQFLFSSSLSHSLLVKHFTELQQRRWNKERGGSSWFIINRFPESILHIRLGNTKFLTICILRDETE